MNIALHKKVLIFLLSSLGLIVLPHVYHLPAGVFAFFYALLAWRWIGIWKPKWLPNRLTVFFLTLGGIALLYSLNQGVFGRDPGTSLFVTALGLKLLEIKSERDIYLINFLAFIVAASQFLFEQSILMALYILFVCCVLLATPFCINSRNPETFPALKYTGGLLVQAIPISIVLFILFPRVDPPRWLIFDEHHAKSGLSDIMEPGSISDLASSDELVFRVRFSGSIPSPDQRYWRGPVLYHTDGKRWTQISYPEKQKNPVQPVFSGQAYRYTLLMEPQNKNWVFALDIPSNFSDPLRQNQNYHLVTDNDPEKRSEYQITSHPHYNTGILTPWEYEQGLQLPGEVSPKIKNFIESQNGFTNTPEKFIEKILAYFRNEDFHYTLTPPLMEENPIETFLFETKQGFCSHYSSAFVYLMRAANIPARVVIGFQGGELNKVGNFLEIRQADAHAWAEVWLNSRGWVRVDPTAAIAPERIQNPINTDQIQQGEIIRYLPVNSNVNNAFNWLRKSRQLWSHVDYNWQRWVINYDNKHQSRFLSTFGIDNINNMIYALLGISSAIMVILAWMLLYRKQKKIDRAVIVYQKFCNKLAKLGLPIETGEGPRDFASRIKLALPKKVQEIEVITSTFMDLRYGKNPRRNSLQTLTKLVARFKIHQ